MENLRVNWLNLLLALFLMVASAGFMNWRDWHPDVFTGWSLLGLSLLAVGALVLGVVAFLAISGDARWAVPVAAVLGMVVGIGGTVFIIKVEIGWVEALAGLGVFAVLGGLIAGISVTRWEPPARRVRVAPPTAP